MKIMVWLLLTEGIIDCVPIARLVYEMFIFVDCLDDTQFIQLKVRPSRSQFDVICYRPIDMVGDYGRMESMDYSDSFAGRYSYTGSLAGLGHYGLNLGQLDSTSISSRQP